MKVQNLHPHLWLTCNPLNPSHANYLLNKRELSTFQSRFASLKVPSKYSASLAKHVPIGMWASMKARDWHVLMQTLLPLCLRGLMQKNTRKAIMWLSRVFQWICAKVINPNEILMFKEDVAMTICMLEVVMAPSFFAMMTYLMSHLVEELNLCGLVHTCWMNCTE